jgi:fatty acid desaturase
MEPTGIDLRSSDAERDRTLTELRTHASEGRLTVEELAERTDAALAARTRAELTALTADLPRPRRRRDPQRARAKRRAELRTYASVMLLLVAIWALTGAGYPWFIWPALGWGMAFVIPCGTGHGRGHRRSPRLTA